MPVARISAVSLGLWALPGYLILVLLAPGTLALWALFAIALSTISILLFVTRSRPSIVRASALLALLGSAATIGLLFLDSAYRVIENLRMPTGPVVAIEHDRHLRPGEVNPRRYYPTESNFLLHKPGWHIQAEIFGESYNLDGAEMLESPTLREELLRPFPVEYRIDREGFRATVPMEEARVFALGDSFTFGVAVRDPETWVHRLGESSSHPVYNLGVTNTSPGQQIAMLSYLLEERSASMAPDHVIWMFFDGNDLEDSYAALAPRPPGRGIGALLRGSLIGWLLQDLPDVIRGQSVLRRLVEGGIGIQSSDETVPRSRRVIDGVELSSAIYRSDRYGVRTFPYPPYIERATKPRSYVLEHPNRPLLDRALEAMAELRDDHGFKVTAVLAPSAARIYGRFFADFPELSERPHFLDYVGERSASLGFDVIDLVPLLEDHATREMLYRRQDTHWTPRGNEVVADFLARELYREAPADEAPSAPPRTP